MQPLPTRELMYLAELCITHLHREEMSLREVRNSLSDIHVALLRGQFQELETIRDRQNQSAENTVQLQAAREDLCRQFGLILGIPSDQINLTCICNNLPASYAERVRNHQTRLQSLAAEVSILQRRNSAVVGYTKTYMTKILASVQAMQPSPVRYGPTGTQVERMPSAHVLTQG